MQNFKKWWNHCIPDRYHLWFWANQREERAQLLRYLKQNDAMFAALKKADIRLILDVDPVHVL